MELPINFKRGFLRAWVGISGLWIGFCLVLGLFDPPKSDQLVSAAAVILGPPALLVLLGRAALWILQGFRRDDGDREGE